MKSGPVSGESGLRGRLCGKSGVAIDPHATLATPKHISSDSPLKSSECRVWTDRLPAKLSLREGAIMRRREIIQAIGLAAVWPRQASAQLRSATTKVVKVGVLWHASNAEEEHEYLAVLIKAFNDLGYVEGKNVEFLHRYPAEQAERYGSLASELVESKVDVIIAVTVDGAVALKQRTKTIPIVFVIVPDPIGAGLVATLARPRGKLTGLSLLANDVSGKRLSLLKEAVPTLSRIALLVTPQEVNASRSIQANTRSAKALGLSLTTIEVATPDTIEPAFLRIEREQFDGVAAGGSMLFNERAKLGASALAHKMPTICIVSEMVPYGLLMSYGQDFPDYFRKAASYAARILSGESPADLPVEQPTRLKLVVNQKVARALGLSLPTSLLVGADEVIE
jgi:putative tryptophan/tyrosine transport system substrate-binding protein